MSWEPLGAVAPERLMFARRVMSSAAICLGDRRLVWDSRRRRFLEPFSSSSSVRMGLLMSPLTVFWADSLGEPHTSLRLAGETPASVAEFVAESTRVPFEVRGEIEPFSELDPPAARELERYLGNGATLLIPIADREERRVLFDPKTLRLETHLLFESAERGEITIGVSLGDDNTPAPYFFVASEAGPWDADLFPLGSSVRWHCDERCEVRLDAEKLLGFSTSGGQEAQARAFLECALAAIRSQGALCAR